MKESSPTELVEENGGEEQKQIRYVSPREIAAYSLTSYGINNLNSFIGGTKQYYMMSYLGIKGTPYGTVSMIASIWDALDDPLSGVIIDRCRSRWGRLRPFLIFPTPLWAITAMLFYLAPHFESAGKIFAYVLVTTIVNGIGNSYLNGWELLLYNITPNQDERSSLIATQKFVNLFTYLPSLVPVFVDFLPSISNNRITQSSVYSVFSIVFVIFAVACTLFGFFNMRERVPLASREEMNQVGLFTSFKLIVKNRPLLVLLLSNFFASVKGVGGASEDFFWLNCTGRLSNRLLCSLFTGLPNYVMTPIAPKLIKKFTLRRTAVFSGFFSGAAYLVMYFVGYKVTGNYWLDFALITFMLTVAGLPNHVMGVCDPMLKGDMFDYLEWKSGIRSEGLVNAVSGYINKLSASVISLVSGSVFDWIGFKPQKDSLGNIVPHKDPKVLHGIWGIFALAPSVARFGYGAALMLFNIHGAFRKKMLEELEVKRLERGEQAGSDEEQG